MTKPDIKPKINHWSAHLLCWGFIVFGILLALSNINIVQFNFTTTVTGLYFIFAGVFLAVESLYEDGKFRLPAQLDIVSLVISIIGFIMGAMTFMRTSIPTEWTGVFFVLAFIVACAIGLEFYTE